MSVRSRYQNIPLHRSQRDSVLFGVCGGIAEYLNVQPWGVRAIVVLLAIFSGFMPMIIIYAILAIVLKPASLISFASDEEEAFWTDVRTSRAAALRKIHGRYESLEKRLQKMESIVTQPGFDLEDDYRRL